MLAGSTRRAAKATTDFLESLSGAALQAESECEHEFGVNIPAEHLLRFLHDGVARAMRRKSASNAGVVETSTCCNGDCTKAKSAFTSTVWFAVRWTPIPLRRSSTSANEFADRQDSTRIEPVVITRDKLTRWPSVMKILVENGDEPGSNSETYGIAERPKRDAAWSRSRVWRTNPCGEELLGITHSPASAAPPRSVTVETLEPGLS